MSEIGFIGFIGYGNMGSMLVNAFLNTGCLKPSQLAICTRTASKLNTLLAEWPEVEIVQSVQQLAQRCSTIFICVKPLEVDALLKQIKDHLTAETHLVSVAASVEIKHIERVFPGCVSKVIPSMTSTIGYGVSLTHHNAKVSKARAAQLNKLLMSISTVIEISEADFEIAADFTSCAPGIISAMLHEYVDAGLSKCTLSRIDVEAMLRITLLGTAQMLFHAGMAYDQLISQVATKGGITEEAVHVLTTRLPPIFDEVFDRTLGKHTQIKQMINENS